DLFGTPTVQFAIDGKPVGTPVTTPTNQIYTAALPLGTLPNGPHTLTAIATDGNSNIATSVGVLFNIGIQPLSASITSPEDLHFATGNQQVTVSTSGGVGPYTFQLIVDGGTPGTATSSPTLTWPTAGLSDTLHSIAVKVTDSANSTVTTA